VTGEGEEERTSVPRNHRVDAVHFRASGALAEMMVLRAKRAQGGYREGTWVTCSPCLKARGFSVQRRSYPRDSPKGLPSPLNVSGRVLIAVEHQPTGGTDMGT
jgi:hypothetical protein